MSSELVALSVEELDSIIQKLEEENSTLLAAIDADNCVIASQRETLELAKEANAQNNALRLQRLNGLLAEHAARPLTIAKIVDELERPLDQN